MFGNGVCRNITSPMTSGAPSWPRRTPVEKVHAGASLWTLSALICLSSEKRRAGEVAARHHPLLRVVLELHQLIVGEGVAGAEKGRRAKQTC